LRGFAFARLYTASTPLRSPGLAQTIPHSALPVSGSTKILRRCRRTPGKRGSFSNSFSDGGCAGWPLGVASAYVRSASPNAAPASSSSCSALARRSSESIFNVAAPTRPITVTRMIRPR